MTSTSTCCAIWTTTSASKSSNIFALISIRACTVKTDWNGNALSRFLHESRPLYSAPSELRIQVSAAIERNSVRYQSRWDWWRLASPLVLNWKTLVPVSLARIIHECEEIGRQKKPPLLQ